MERACWLKRRATWLAKAGVREGWRGRRWRGRGGLESCGKEIVVAAWASYVGVQIAGCIERTYMALPQQSL